MPTLRLPKRANIGGFLPKACWIACPTEKRPVMVEAMRTLQRAKKGRWRRFGEFPRKLFRSLVNGEWNGLESCGIELEESLKLSVVSEAMNRSSVQAAIDEFDRVGRDHFLATYGFGRARRYFVKVGSSLYDSKALFGAAYGYEHPRVGPLGPADFSGGEKTVARRFRDLGLEMLVEAESPNSRNR